MDQPGEGVQAQDSPPLDPERALAITGELMRTLDSIFAVFEADRARSSASRITTGPVHAVARSRSALS